MDAARGCVYTGRLNSGQISRSATPKPWARLSGRIYSCRVCAPLPYTSPTQAAGIPRENGILQSVEPMILRGACPVSAVTAAQISFSNDA